MENKEYYDLLFNKEYLESELIDGNKSLEIFVPEKKVKVIDNKLFGGKQPKKIKWVKNTIKSEFLSFKDAVILISSLLDKNFERVEKKMEFNPILNNKGVLNNVFFPKFFLVQIEKDKFLICDYKLNSYPSIILNNFILFNNIEG
jgi:hypothetical protein